MMFLRRAFFLSLVFLCVSCGGGTQGTGGDRPIRSLQIVRMDGSPVPGVTVRGAGLAFETTSDESGLAKVEINEGLIQQAFQLRFLNFGQESSVVRYVARSQLESSYTAPVVVNISSPDSSLGKERDDDSACESVITNWQTTLGQPDNGLSIEAEQVIAGSGKEAGGRRCEERLADIEEAVFSS